MAKGKQRQVISLETVRLKIYKKKRAPYREMTNMYKLLYFTPTYTNVAKKAGCFVFYLLAHILYSYMCFVVFLPSHNLP